MVSIQRESAVCVVKLDTRFAIMTRLRAVMNEVHYVITPYAELAALAEQEFTPASLLMPLWKSWGTI